MKRRLAALALMAAGISCSEPVRDTTAEDLDRLLTDLHSQVRAGRPVSQEQVHAVRGYCDRLKRAIVAANRGGQAEEMDRLVRLEKAVDEARSASAPPDGKADFPAAARALDRARSFAPGS